MRILCIADEESPALWDHFTKDRLNGIDLIISCGDLKPEYLRFLVTMARVPVFYVHGNHDENYENDPPEGCDDIDDAVLSYNGLRILGLGGCKKYREGKYHFSERKMRYRIFRLFGAINRAKGVDLIVTHAPPKGYGDIDNRTHEGFSCFAWLIDKLRPKALIHGHIHLNYTDNIQRVVMLGNTKIINVSGRYVLDVEEGRDRGVKWYTKRKEPDYSFEKGKNNDN